jgi:hypothetical protein
VEQDPEGEEVGQGALEAGLRRFFGFGSPVKGVSTWPSSKRQEGNGAGDGVQLHERRKALEGGTP